MSAWQAVAARLMEVPVPKKSFTFNVSDNALLNELTTRLGTTQTDAIRTAMRDTVARLRNREPIYLAVPPEATSPPPTRPQRTPQVVEKPHGARRTPPAKGPANTKRRKK